MRDIQCSIDMKPAILMFITRNHIAMTPSDDGRKRNNHHRARIGPGNVARLLGEGLVGEQVGSCRRAGTCGPQESEVKESELLQPTRSKENKTDANQSREEATNDSHQ